MTDIQYAIHPLPGIPYGGDYNPEQWPEDVCWRIFN